MPDHSPRPSGLRRPRPSLGLKGKLLLLLLATGLVPLALAIYAGYQAGRSTILAQARSTLDAVTGAQATHFTTELDRQRLLLRTIATQLPAGAAVLSTSPQRLSAFLRRSLLEDGVFDGLRLTTDSGRILATVALRRAAPHWPATAPATDWNQARVAVHRNATGVLAYLVAARVSQDPDIWLEGHVRREDFDRLFGIPLPPLPGVALAVTEPDGALVLGEFPGIGTRQDGMPVLRPAFDSAAVLISTAPIAGSDWRLMAGLPTDIALAPLTRLRTPVLLGTSGLLMLVLLVTVLATRSVTVPLQRLAIAFEDFAVEGTYRPITGVAGDEIATLIAAFDRMAEALTRSREEVAALHATELERAQQLATVGELASGVAHEIRNPLTGVRGALDLALRDDASVVESRPLLEEAQRQLTRIEATTAQLLQYARPPIVKRIPVALGLLVDRAASVVSPQATARSIPIEVLHDPVEVTVTADAELIVQVLVNLLLNALDVTADGGRVTVWTARHAPEGWIGVQDHGPGIPVERRQEVFRPFFTTKSKGTGLGLSISRNIAVRHGGDLVIADTPGGGATFILSIPLQPE